MAKKSKDIENNVNSTENNIQKALSALKSQFGSDSVMTFEDNTSSDVEFISTGSLSLDLALGGGMPLGRIVEIYGPESSGKSTICLQVCAEAQKKGYNVAYIDLENALDRKYMQQLGCDLKNMIISQPSSGEEAFNIAEVLLKNNYVNVIVFDSVASMLTKAEINGEVGDSFIGVQARLMSAGLKKITPLASKANCLCIFTNQIRNKIGVLFGSPETTAGGEALKFYASQRMRISRTTAPVKNGEEAIGNETKVKVIKNKVFPPFREASFTILYGEGVSKLNEILSFSVKYGFIEKAGSYYRWNGENIAQGEAKALAWLKSKPELQVELFEKIKNKAFATEEIQNEPSEITELEKDIETLQDITADISIEGENDLLD